MVERYQKGQGDVLALQRAVFGIAVLIVEQFIGERFQPDRLSHVFRQGTCRLARRRGEKRAIVAVSHSLLVIIYHLLRTSQDYHDLGPHFFETLDTTRQRETAVRRLQALGYTVTLEEKKEVQA